MSLLDHKDYSKKELMEIVRIQEEAYKALLHGKTKIEEASVMLTQALIVAADTLEDTVNEIRSNL